LIEERQLMTSWRIGDVTITKVVELEAPLPLGPGSMLPDANPEAITQVPGVIPDFATEQGFALMSVHSFLIQTPTGRIVIDTCVGNDKTRTNPLYNGLATPFLQQLESVPGWSREAVDAVLCTHLHVDHVGWNTLRAGNEWRPTFPRATYCLGASEFEHWQEAPHGSDADLLSLDSLQPVIAAGQLETVEDGGAALGPEITLAPTPGHTPGHVSVTINSRDERAVITGDVFHHASQVTHPTWRCTFDTLPEQAEETRNAFLREYADAGALVLGTHFGGATGGTIVKTEAGYTFRP
jgi:glyoxylase-like metal-dependent hydrolase (beta-lactamase superfamily II)